MKKIGMIGFGNMGQAVGHSIRTADPDVSLLVNDINAAQLLAVGQSMKAHFVPVDRLIEESEMIFVAVKPYQLVGLFQELTPLIEAASPKHWVSMCASVSLAKLAQLTPDGHDWIRMMPNTPLRVGAGFVSYCCGSGVSSATEEAFVSLLSPCASLAPIGEELFDIATAVAGSGPAFIYQLIEAMSDAGVAGGLSRQQAIEMAATTVRGASEMVLVTGEHPAALKDQVTSPAGTTIAGVIATDQHQLRSAIAAGIQAAYDRSQAMQLD